MRFTFGDWENMSKRRYDGRTKWSRRDVNSSEYPINEKDRLQKAVQAIGTYRRVKSTDRPMPLHGDTSARDIWDSIVKEAFDYLDGLSDQERTKAYDIAG